MIAAENVLNGYSHLKGFSPLLLQISSNSEMEVIIQQGAAVYLKNLVKKYWVAEDSSASLDVGDKEVLKSAVVASLLSTSYAVSLQMSEIISLIAVHEFPQEWPSLLPSMLQLLKQTDLKKQTLILKSLHGYFKRYRSVFLNDTLKVELNYVYQELAAPLTQMFTMFCEQFASCNLDQMGDQLNVVLQILKIFWSLCASDLSEYFEQNLKSWLSGMLHFLSLRHKDSNNVGELLLRVQSAVCAVGDVFCSRYEELFEQWVQPYSQAAWQLLVTVPEDEDYDPLVITCLRFLMSVARGTYSPLFDSEEVLRTICVNIVLPHIRLRDVDEELFEDNPIDYIRRDMEGTDSETRRRACFDLVKMLAEKYEQKATAMVGEYVGNMLGNYQQNPSENWNQKDAALSLVAAVAIKTKTAAAGATSVAAWLNVTDFFQTHILPELEKECDTLPLLKASCLKFVCLFRSLLPPQTFAVLMPLLLKHLKSTHVVVHSYAAVAMERLLTTRDNGATGTWRWGRTDCQPFLPSTLSSLFELLLLPSAISRENEYVIKAIMRFCMVVESDMAPFASAALTSLNSILGHIAANPSNGNFTHYLFETVACMIRAVGVVSQQALSELEAQLFPPFQSILQGDLQDFMPYVFQVMAQMLEIRQHTFHSITEPYLLFFPAALAPALWERPANIPALRRLMGAYLSANGAAIATSSSLQGVLGIFQKVLSTATYDSEALLLLEAIIEDVPLAQLQPFFPTILSLLFTRLQSEKEKEKKGLGRAPKFYAALVKFIAHATVKMGGDVLIAQVDGLQNGLWGSLLNAVVISKCSLVTDAVDRRLVAVGMVHLLCQTKVMLNENYIGQWPVLLLALVQLLEGDAPVTAGEDESNWWEQEEVQVDRSSFSRLHNAPELQVSPIATMQETPAQFLGQQLGALSKQHPSLLGKLLQERLPEKANYVAQYCGSQNAEISW